MSEKVQSRLAASFLPATAVLEMTYACNHRCLFCSCPWYAEGNGFDQRPELELPSWKRILEKLCRMGVVDLAFTGGEPLLKQGLEELIVHAAGLEAEHVRTQDGGLVVEPGPPHLFLLTNGRILSERVLELCARHRVHLGMSLPGVTSFTDHTRASDAAHVLGWFRRAKALGIETHVGITVTRLNLHELYETMGEALLAGADSVLLNRFMPGGRGLAHARELALDADGVRQMLSTAEEVLRLANRRGNVGTELPRCLFDPAAHTHLDVGSQCAAATGFFCIDPSGYVRVCNHSPVRLEHFDAIEAVKDNPYWRRFVQKDYLPRACAGCREIGRCDAGCREAAHIACGAVDALDPLLPSVTPLK
ncbi:MAG TPA: radical SAM protein [Myxococcota bacterium]|nr:radical SAM protein [Myxococcota bacterium]HRY92433.1 radical SAM protein [Myxococcota bacterium]HSA22770.1 radical SAM protein [Myxococcota bacterium]